MRFPIAVLALAVSCNASFSAFAQTYPSKPVRLLTLFAPGSTGDTSVRIWSTTLGQILGQPVIIENVPGAGGVLAADRTAKSPADGYTLLYSLSSVHVFRTYLAKSTPFHPINDFTPITEVGETVTLLVANPQAPYSTLRQMVDYAKANPGKVSYGTSGIGSPTHLAGELIQQITGVQLVHVPYKAVSQAFVDVMAGQIPTSYGIAGQVAPAVRSGKVKVLGVTGQRRWSRAPDVPTLAEALPGYEPVPSWTGVFAPAGLPQPILTKLNADLIKALNAPEVKSRLAEADFDVITMTPGEFVEKLKKETQLVGRIVKRAGIQATE